MLKSNTKSNTRTNTSDKSKDSTFVEQAIKISRVNKVTTGGKRLAFRAFVIVGDQNGRVGIGIGKSKEVPVAIKKGIDRAKKDLFKVNIVDGTLPHPVLAQFGAAKVLLKPAKPGTGVIAGGSVRILLESAGFKDVVAKCIGGSNTINNAKAAVEGLKSLKDYSEQVKLRGKKFSVGRRQPKEEVKENE